MKSSIIIGDIHGKKTWEFLISDRNSYEKIIFVGDYVDSFDIAPGLMLNNLERIIAFKKKHPDKVILLLGNHDFQYLYEGYYCSGYDDHMFFSYHSLLKENHKLFDIACECNGFLVTHAGVLEPWLEKAVKLVDTKYEFLLNSKEKKVSDLVDFLNSAHQLDERVFFMVSTARGGLRPIGNSSPLWADFKKEIEYYLKDVKQIFGHSHVKKISWHEERIACVDCLDYRNEFLTIFPNGSRSHMEVFNDTVYGKNVYVPF